MHPSHPTLYNMECPPAPMKHRIRRCEFDDPSYINVKYIETKVYDSGHVENISCDRVYCISDVDIGDNMLHTATKCSYISRNTADKIVINGHAIAVYDCRIHSSSTLGIKFHQVILIRQ